MLHHFLFIYLKNSQAYAVQYLLPLDEEDIPNSQRQFQRHVTAEQRHEPLSCVKRWHEILLLQMHIQLGHVLLQQHQEDVVRGLQPRHRSLIEFFHLVLLPVYDFQHDAESVFFVNVSEQNGCHVAHALDVPQLWLDDAEALEDGEEVLLAMVELLLEVNMVRERPGNVFVYIR